MMHVAFKYGMSVNLCYLFSSLPCRLWPIPPSNTSTCLGDGPSPKRR